MKTKSYTRQVKEEKKMGLLTLIFPNSDGTGDHDGKDNFLS